MARIELDAFVSEHVGCGTAEEPALWIERDGEGVTAACRCGQGWIAGTSGGLGHIIGTAIGRAWGQWIAKDPVGALGFINAERMKEGAAPIPLVRTEGGLGLAPVSGPDGVRVVMTGGH